MDENQKPKDRNSVSVRAAHLSMQFSDTEGQMRHDVDKLLGRGYDWITGTEAGPGNPLQHILQNEARDAGYRLHVARETFVAVHRDFIRTDWETGFLPIIESTEGHGKHADRGITWAAFNAEHQIGRVTIGAGHLLTKGRNPGDPNYRLNKEFGRELGNWVDVVAQGAALAFYGGDQNIVDRTEDTFFGSPMTSTWDELGRYENTGHGNIDVIASYDRDGRVEAKSVRALDDREEHFFTDHFLVESVFKIRTLN